MAFKEPSIKWNELISFNSNGDVYVANFIEIREAIIKRFKEIYGDDIDVSTGTADGVYVQTLSLMINNILQSFKQYFSQLNIKTASGKFLDALCALSNVTRKQETYSTTVLKLTSQQSGQDITFTELQFVDGTGQTWTYKGDKITIAPYDNVSITVTCDKAGPVGIEAGSIKKLVNQDLLLTIEQPNAADVGSYAETDSELRTRQSSVLSSTGNTVLETIAAALYQINGIKDVKIYNNATASEHSLSDKVTINPHDIYVVIRQQANVHIDNQTIADAIYKHLTPGIKTTDASGCLYGNACSAIYSQAIEAVTQTVYWKNANGWTPTTTITIEPRDNFDATNTPTTIGQACIDYLNALPIAASYSPVDLYAVIMNADPLFKSRATFITTSVYIDNVTGNAQTSLPYTFFNFKTVTSKKQEDGTYLISLS